MASDLASVTLFVGTSAGINAVNKVSKQADPVPGLIASFTLFAVFAIIGSIWRWDVVKAIAAVMLLSTVLFQGVPLFNTLSKFVSALNSNVRTAVPVTPSGGSGGRGSSGSGGGGGGGGGV